MSSIFLDITELLRNPIRSGIQRVVRKLLEHWPAEIPMRLAHFDRDRGLLAVSDRVVPLVTENSVELRDLSFDALRSRIASELQKPGLALPAHALAFVPEVFFDHARCAYYRERLRMDPHGSAFLLYDFIPWLYSDHFGGGGVAHLMPYLALIRDAPKTAFISSQTRAEYLRRIRRGRGGGGPVLPLGADGFDLERQSFTPLRRSFVAIGSIDGRKNQEQIVAAFVSLWQQGLAPPLVLIGRAFEHVNRDFLDQANTYPLFSWFEEASDEMVKRVMRGARATIYVSDVEGYGIPPVESLHVGIPVIATATVPSLMDLPTNGQIRLDTAQPEGIAAAVRRFEDDPAAAQLWDEVGELRLPTWRDCARQAAEWMADS